MILKNERLGELEKFCLNEPEKHAFTIWDLRMERDNTDFFISWDGGVRGYMLIYYGATVPSVILYGDEESIERLIKHMNLEKAIIHLPYKYRTLWEREGMVYKVLVMAREPAKFNVSPDIVRIRDKEALSQLFQDPSYLVKKARTWGIMRDGYAISSISALAYTPEVWVLGALITKRRYRKRGYAKKLVEFFLNEAYGKTRKVVLWVRSDNYPAINLYRKYDFQIIAEDAWINVGVDIVP